MPDKTKPEGPAAFPYHLPITTRWHDNDLYGHVNNVTYYSYFDTVANHYLIHEGGLDIHEGGEVGFVVESGCRYFAPIAYPDAVMAGLRVEHLGNSSVRYGIGIFKEGREEACAQGHFIHVFVDKESQKPVQIPDLVRKALRAILVVMEDGA